MNANKCLSCHRWLLLRDLVDSETQCEHCRGASDTLSKRRRQVHVLATDTVLLHFANDVKRNGLVTVREAMEAMNDNNVVAIYYQDKCGHM